MTIGFHFARHLMAPFLAHTWGQDNNRSMGPYRRKAPAAVAFVPGTTVHLLPLAGVPLREGNTEYDVVGVGFEGNLLVVNLA